MWHLTVCLLAWSPWAHLHMDEHVAQSCVLSVLHTRVCDWPGWWCRLGGLSLHALCAAQEVLPHGQLHISRDVRRCVAYLHRSLQEAHRAHRVLHLLCRHGDRWLLGTGQRRGRQLLCVVLWAEGRVRVAGLGRSPMCTAQFPGHESEKSQQRQATDHKHTEQEAKSGVWWWAAGTRNRTSHNMEEQMVREERERDNLLEHVWCLSVLFI